MLTAEILKDNILNIIQTHQVSSVFINGAPGSGKTHFLQQLTQWLPHKLPYSNVFEPVVEQMNLVQQLLQALKQQGYIDTLPKHLEKTDVASVWQWVDQQGYLSAKQKFIVWLDLPAVPREGHDQLGQLFSSIRFAESLQLTKPVRICHVVIGFWDTTQIEIYCQEIGVSLPYTEGFNYFHWQGISLTDMRQLLQQKVQSPLLPILEEVLYEMVDGCPQVALQVLERISAEQVGLTTLMEATTQLAQQSASFLEQTGQFLDVDCKQVLGELVLKRHIQMDLPIASQNRLLQTGLVKQEKMGDHIFLSFRAWFFELLVRFQGEVIGVSIPKSEKVRTHELVPSVSVLNRELYRLIHTIENLTRNFVVIQLSQLQEEEVELLKGIDVRLDEVSGQMRNAYDRAKEWYAQVQGQEIVANDLNVLITYISTRDLAKLIEALMKQSQNYEWADIAQAMRQMANIRDAVMHHQLVDEKALVYLYDLQEKIYLAINKI